MASHHLILKSIARRATSLGAGPIAGIVVGVVIFVGLIILCALPFILRAKRDARARRLEAATAAEMGMAPGVGRASAVVSPTSTRRLSMDQYPPVTESARDSIPRPVKEYSLDGNSYEEASNGMAPNGTVQHGRTSPGSPFPAPRLDVSGSVSRYPPGDGVMRTDSPQAMEPPISIAGTMGPPAAQGRPDHQKYRKSSKGSISQAIEDLAGRASAVFRRTSTRSERTMHSPVRSPTFDFEDTLVPAMSAPHLIASEIPTTGASAEYYSGAPMSPPEMEDYPVAPVPASYPPSSIGLVTTKLVSMSAMNALAGTPKAFSRTDSQLTGQTDFSPLSPVSPPIKLEHSFDEEDEDLDRLRDGQVFPETSEEEELARIKPEFSPPPSKQRIVPSPPLPAPGTGNPMDIWAPVIDSERTHHVTVELDRIENSPPPAAAPVTPKKESTPETDINDVQQFESTYNDADDEFLAAITTAYDDYNQTNSQPIIAEPIVTPPSHPYTATQRDVDMQDIPTDISTPLPTSQSSGLSREHTPHHTPLTVPGSEYANSASPASNWASTPNHSSTSGASPRSFTCDECGRSFDQVHKLNHHKRYHERPHECTHPGCGKRFGTKTHLDRHINDKHNKTRKYHCTEHGCPYSKQGGKSFPRKDNWRRHMQNKHNCNPDHDPVEVVDEPMAGT